MSDNIAGSVGRTAREAATALCWAQWIGLGSLGLPARSQRSRSIIDPEALILLSLYVSEEERRLRDMVAWWARAGSGLTSVHRLRTVASRFPDEVMSEEVPLFSLLAAQAGDRRWRRGASGAVPEWVRPDKGPESLRLIEPSALWPRLRAGFGVGAKADALVFLLGLRGAWASTRLISFATGYSTVAVRKAVSEMALARLLRETEGRPAQYLAPSRTWAALLDLNDEGEEGESGPSLPTWRFWSDVFGFLAKAIAWSRRAAAEGGPSVRVAASEARDLMEAHSKAFQLNNISVPAPESFKGRDAVQGLLETVDTVSGWAREHV